MQTNCMELKPIVFKKVPKEKQIECLSESTEKERFNFFFIDRFTKEFVIAREKKTNKEYWLVGGSPFPIKVIYEVPKSDYVICGSCDKQIDIWKIPQTKREPQSGNFVKLLEFIRNPKKFLAKGNIGPIYSMKHAEDFEDIKISKDITNIVLTKKDYIKEEFTLSTIDQSACPILRNIHMNIQKKNDEKNEIRENHSSDSSRACDDNEAHLTEKQAPKYNCSTYISLLTDFFNRRN